MMKIGITQRVIEHEEYVDRRDALSQDWTSWVGAILPAAILIPIPNLLTDPKQWCDALGLDAIILSSGNDWGESQERDALETSIVEWAVAARRPLLGVCRGLYVINVAFGGGLCEDIKLACRESHVTKNHEVDIVDTRFETLFATDRMSVNSYHNQGVLTDEAATGLKVFAERNGCVEGIYHPDKPILAIQWHPERDNVDAERSDSVAGRFLQEGVIW